MVISGSGENGKSESRCVRDRLRYSLGTGVLPFFMLAFLGFGGGLFLATMGIETPQDQARIGAVAPEIVYLPPPRSDSALTNESFGPVITQTSPDGISTTVGPAPSVSIASGSTPAAPLETAFSTLAQAVGSPASDVVSFEITTPSPSALIAYQPADPAKPAASDVAFDAVKTAIVPEPSSALLVVLSSVGLALIYLRRRH